MLKKIFGLKCCVLYINVMFYVSAATCKMSRDVHPLFLHVLSCIVRMVNYRQKILDLLRGAVG